MSFHNLRLLIVDDNEDVLTAVRLLCERAGAKVDTTTSPAALPTLLEEHSYDVILLDMNFTRDASGGHEGLTYLERLLQIDPQASIVMITAYGDIALAVEAMKRGAVDFVTKPWQNERLLATLAAAARLRASRSEADRLRIQRDALLSSQDATFPELLGESVSMQRVLATVEKVAATDANVLLLGENGTGKELVAQALHRLSHRADEVFVRVDVGSLPETLFESELFGTARGAFTGAVQDRAGRFEAAHGGTLFLDEIGNINLLQQAKLLSALQTRTVARIGETRQREVDIRLICATNIPLRERVAAGDFRQDLLYRINTVEITLPPLRDRSQDVPLLAKHFLQDYATRYGRQGLRLNSDALQRLTAYHWPGNVRELQHVIERAVVLAEKEVIEGDDLAVSVRASVGSINGENAPTTLDLEVIERDAIRRALSKHGGNISRAAGELGLTRKSLYRRIEKYGL